VSKTERAPWGSKRPFQRQYQIHKWNAKHRNIDWLFTYDTWIAWWGEDIENRGHSKGKLVMARFNDQGPYCPTNVKKITHSENVSESTTGSTHWIGRKHSDETKAKIRATKAMKKEMEMS
jgi:hypothetical protein